MMNVDLSGVTFEQAKSQFVDYQQMRAFPNYSSSINNFHKNDSPLTEADGSKPLDIVKKEISNKYFLADWQFQIRTASNKIQLAIVIPEINKNISLIKNDMMRMGYFNSASQTRNIQGYDYAVMQFEPKYQDNVLNDVKNMKVLYHSTLTSNIDNIMRNGFIASHKNKTFTYPDRIYFSKGNTNVRGLIDIIVQLAQTNNVRPNDYSVIAIDTKLIPDNIKFYYDPNYEDGVFTEDNLPNSVIKSVISYDKLIQIARDIGYNI